MPAPPGLPNTLHTQRRCCARSVPLLYVTLPQDINPVHVRWLTADFGAEREFVEDTCHKRRVQTWVVQEVGWPPCPGLACGTLCC